MKPLNLLNLIPEKSLSNFKMDLEKKGDEFLIWYRANYSHWGYKDVKTHYLPQVIETDDLFWESLGILQGEMKKSLKNFSYANISFSNSDPEIINHVISFFEKFFNIKRNSWRATIHYNVKDFNIPSGFDLELQNIWKDRISLNRDQFTKVLFNPRQRSVYTKIGSVNLKYCNSAFSSFFFNVFDVCKKYVENEPEIVIPYLRGVMAAEGSSYNRKGFLNEVSIGAKPLKEKMHYKKCLEVLNIKNIQVCKGNQIKIHGWKNFFVLYKIDAFKLHITRKRKFVDGFLKNESTRKLLLLKNLETPKTLKELSHLQLATRTLNMHFNNFYKTGLTDRNRIFNKDGSWYYTWFITAKGEDVLSVFKHL